MSHKVNLIRSPPFFAHTSISMANAIEDRYKRKDLRSHILTRPGIYIGSVDPESTTTFIINDEGTEALEKR